MCYYVTGKTRADTHTRGIRIRLYTCTHVYTRTRGVYVHGSTLMNTSTHAHTNTHGSTHVCTPIHAHRAYTIIYTYTYTGTHAYTPRTQSIHPNLHIHVQMYARHTHAHMVCTIINSYTYTHAQTMYYQ